LAAAAKHRRDRPARGSVTPLADQMHPGGRPSGRPLLMLRP
jgi:hypothetical protein